MAHESRFPTHSKPPHWGLRLLFLVSFCLKLSGLEIVVSPYLQPGDGSSLGTTDVKIVAWMTDATAADFRVEYGWNGSAIQSTQPIVTPLNVESERYHIYAATMTGLPLNREVWYTVKSTDRTIGDGMFQTRKTPDHPLHFVVTGDLADDQPPHRAIAYQIARFRPEFLIACGDIVYDRGRLQQYQRNFWPTYCNVALPSVGIGAPLMRSVPFYIALGNHDVERTDLDSMPDAFAAFYFFHPPKNIPAGPWTTPISGSPARVEAFLRAAKPAGYPHLSLYSFDNGPAHFLVLDSNAYAPLTDERFLHLIRQDLAAAKTRWKLVFFHHPGFSSANKHAGDQRMRLLAPVLEAGGVDVVFSGHVHDYQRSKPLRFTPANPASPLVRGPVRGAFVLHEGSDDRSRSTPHDIVYIVTGGGGAPLYQRQPGDQDTFVRDPDIDETFTAKFMADRHSFTVVDIDAKELRLRQVDINGETVDSVTIAKPGL